MSSGRGVNLTKKVGGSSEIEMPKASRGRGMGRECPPPQPTRGFGERRKLPQRAPAENGFLVHFELDGTHLVSGNNTFCICEMSERHIKNSKGIERDVPQMLFPSQALNH